MFKNYLKIAYRNTIRHKGYAVINVAGLAIGMVCCILILLFVFDELSYDKFNENHDRIYRVTRKWFNEDGIVNLHLGHVAPPIGPLLENDFPEILHSVRIIRIGRSLVENNSRYFEEPRFFFAEKDIFKVFTFDMIAGNPETALRDPFTVVITEEMAHKYFGAENPVGKSLTLQVSTQEAEMKVTGVIKPLPHNSHFHADFLGSFKTFEAVVGEQELQNWGSNNYATYLLMPEKHDINRLKGQLDPFINKHMSQGMSERTKLQLQALTDIHLHSHLDSEIEANSDITYVYVFSIIALFILLIACVNFMNLATARSAGRAKEIGMRKVVGAQRNQLIRQFLGESIFTAVISLLIAVVIVLLIIPKFNQFIGKGFSYGSRKGQIIGVVKDFHFESLHQEISPIVMFISSTSLNQISIRISPHNIPKTIGFLQKIWREVRPNYPFSYYFIDENFDQQYKSEEKLLQTFSYFAFLAIFIGCLGLFGLVSYSTERRTKEIGIRKVLGASTAGLVLLLSKEFTKWVLLANIIAWPTAYLIMNQWLQNFAYRSSINPGIFIAAGALAWVIAFLTISYQSIKTAAANPVDSLRHE